MSVDSATFGALDAQADGPLAGPDEDDFSYIKFANRLAWSLNGILRVLQLDLFDRRPILDVLEPTSDPPTDPPEQLQLKFA